MGRAALGGRGHAVRFIDIDDGNSVVYCANCGAYAIRRAIGLLGACTGHPTVAGREALQRISEGRSPDPLSKGHIVTDASVKASTVAGATARKSKQRPAPPSATLLPSLQRMAERLGLVEAGDTASL